MKISYKTVRLISKMVFIIVVSILLFETLSPIYFAMKASLGEEKHIYEKALLPLSLTINNYLKLGEEIAQTGSVGGTSFVTFVRNSTIIAISVMLISIVASTMAGYSIARFRYRGKNAFSIFILFNYLFPPIVLMVPIFLIMAMLELLNTYQAIILAHLTRTVPFGTWLLMGYFRTIPPDMEESALVDGCNRFQAFIKIALPMAMPGIVVAAIFSFTLSWNDFLFGFILADQPTVLPLSVATVRLIQFEYVQWSVLMAAGLVAAAVPIMLYFAIQRYIVGGLTAGAVKA